MAASPLANPARRRLLFVGVTALLIALAARLLLGGSPPARPAPPPAPVLESDIADYMGNAACAPCHPKEAQLFEASSHAHALRPMTRAALGEMTPPPGPINGSQYALVEKDGQFYFEVNPPGMPDKYQLWPLNYAFGSGRSGISFVSMLEGRNVVEMKMSYFPHQHLWRVTPGQKLDNPASAGNLGNLMQSRKCLGCHIIAMSKSAYTPHPELLGVGCESCHGPGRAHIAAVQAGASDLKMARLERLKPRDLNLLCGRCHQTEQAVMPSASLSKMTFRFQPYAIMRSRCYRESGGQLSCLNCHDAHTNVSLDPASYTPACLACHSPNQKRAPLPAGAHPGKVCPINSRANCVPCHMPPRDMLSATHEVSGIPMTEHLIAVYPPAKP